ncbi:MAG TPA: two-component regulator propeller domain-containing protein [Saprospiraceae bacterium]|nr:two-component regulator propeller domain-containing protein [Saprospiraceae bacterium]
MIRQIASLILRFLPVGFIFYLVHGVAQPEIIRFERLSDEEGLPSNLFTEVIQDKYGLLWMAGLDGLARYDGYTVKSFRHNHLDTTSISGNNISALYADAKGRIWLGITGGGLNVSDDAQSVFSQIELPPGYLDKLPLRITDITEDSTGRMWIASDAGLYTVIKSKDGFIIEPLKADLAKRLSSSFFSRPHVLTTDTDGRIWIGTAEGLAMIDLRMDKIYYPSDFPGLPHIAIQDIEFDREGRLWVSCPGEEARLFFTSPEHWHFRAFTGIPFVSASRGLQFTFDLDNRLWALVFGDQAYGYDFRDSTLFLQSSLNSDISHERFFRKPFIDHSGNAWLPVEGFYIHPYPKGFHTYLHPFAFHQSNSCIYGTEDFLWFGYREKGLVRLDQRTSAAVHFSTLNTGHQHIPVDHIQGVLKVLSGNYILVGFSNIAIMNPDGKIVGSHAVNGTNRAAFQDASGRIWIGGYHGLYLFSESQGVTRTYTVASDTSGKGQYIQTIRQDAKGNIWFASDLHGLCRLDPGSGEIMQFLPRQGDTTSLPTRSVLDIDVDKSGLLWLATDMALVRFDPVTFEMKSLDKNDGLANDYIASVICTPDGLVWVSTHSGISRYDPASDVFVNYNATDGLSNYSYYTRSKYVSDAGVLYFGGKNGVDYFHPAKLRDNPTAPKMFLSSFSINNEVDFCGYTFEDFSAGLELSYKDKLLGFEFAGLHYADQEDVRYEYKMEGLHDDWIDLGHQRNVLISGLAPGRYVLHAKAITGDQVWSENELKIPIHISPPFYATAWFRMIAILVLLGILYQIIRSREQAIKRKDKMEAEVNRKIVELERRALQAQMNPHFIYNSMNSIQQFMIIHDIEGAMKYLTKFSRILRTVLNISAQNRIPLADEITLIKDYLELENMRFPDKFTYEIKVSPEINIHAVDIPPFFIQPQVENAIRHGLLKKTSPGHLSIEITSDGRQLYIVVEDNGIGREASRRTKFNEAIGNESKGLAIVKERLSHLNPANGFTPFKIIDLYDADNNAAGTRVEIILPID